MPSNRLFNRSKANGMCADVHVQWHIISYHTVQIQTWSIFIILLIFVLLESALVIIVRLTVRVLVKEQWCLWNLKGRHLLRMHFSTYLCNIPANKVTFCTCKFGKATYTLHSLIISYRLTPEFEMVNILIIIATFRRVMAVNKKHGV